jgi:hypothetical protein
LHCGRLFIFPTLLWRRIVQSTCPSYAIPCHPCRQSPAPLRRLQPAPVPRVSALRRFRTLLQPTPAQCRDWIGRAGSRAARQQLLLSLHHRLDYGWAALLNNDRMPHGDLHSHAWRLLTNPQAAQRLPPPRPSPTLFRAPLSSRLRRRSPPPFHPSATRARVAPPAAVAHRRPPPPGPRPPGLLANRRGPFCQRGGRRSTPGPLRGTAAAAAPARRAELVQDSPCRFSLVSGRWWCGAATRLGGSAGCEGGGENRGRRLQEAPKQLKGSCCGASCRSASVF